MLGLIFYFFILLLLFKFFYEHCHLTFYPTGIWGFGVATRKCNLNTLPLGSKAESWVLRSDGSICHNGEVTHKIEGDIAEGDIIVSLNLLRIEEF